MEATDRALPEATAAELYPCPVRRRYLWQLLRYRPAMRRAEQLLVRGAAGDRTVGAGPLRALLEAAERETGLYPRTFAEAGVQWGDLRDGLDLRAFPLLTRATLQAGHRELLSRRLTALDVDEGWMGLTSGSTGQPVRFFMDAGSIHFFLAFIRFLWRQRGCGPLPRPGSTGVVLLCTLPKSSIYETWLPLFRGTRFRKLHWAEPEAASTLTALGPAVLTGDPDSLRRLAEACESGEVAVRPRLILSSAFELPASLAERLRAATGAHVIDYYSMAETGPIAWSCGRGRFHLLEGAVELEAVDGELVLTNLRNRLFPLIRYRTGDLGALDERPCACGFHGRSVTRLAGRVAARFVGAGGERRDPSQLQPLLSRLDVRQFQLVQEAPGTVVLRHHSAAELGQNALGEVEQALARLLGQRIAISAVRSETPLFRAGEKPIVYLSRVPG